METPEKIQQRIQGLEHEIKMLKKELLRIEQLTPEQQIAEYMHNKLCRHNHTDGCSWEYEKNWTDHTHAKYLHKATLLLKDIEYKGIYDDISACKSIIDIIKM